MDALQNLFNRRSVRDFTAQPIEEEKLHRILEAGMSTRNHLRESTEVVNTTTGL